MRGIKIFLAVLISFTSIALSAQDAATVLARMDATIFAIKDRSVNMRMVMTNLKSGKEKVKEAVLYQKDMDKKLFRYTAPESDAGISTLALPNSEIYVYLPMFKKPKKITNLAESGVFTSSDFSIDDMASQTYAEKYTPEILSSEGDAFVLNLTPKDEKPVWARVEVHVDKRFYYPVRIDYFNKKDELEKQALYKYTEISGYWVTEEVSMEDMKKEHKTTLYMSDIKVNQGIKDDLFTLENLVPEEDKG